jgi:hypothetical protein
MHLSAQTNTEVYLVNVESAYAGLEIYNFQNISNDKGYDSQPSFSNNNEVIFAGNNNGQTDIALFNISEKTKTWCHSPTPGGEYSPRIIPNSKNISAVRLDPDGLQRLYVYDSTSDSSVELIEDVQVAYYTYFNKNTVVASVLSDGSLDLIVSDLTNKKTDTILTNTGRSIHKIPNSSSISYTAMNEEKNQDLYLLDMNSGESFFVCQLPIGIQDYAWLNDSQITIGSGNKLYLYDTFLNEDWKEVADLSEFKIKEISRLAVSPDKKRIALVAEPLSN